MCVCVYYAFVSGIPLKDHEASRNLLSSEMSSFKDGVLHTMRVRKTEIHHYLSVWAERNEQETYDRHR